MERLARFSVENPWLTVAIVAVISVVLGAGLPHVENEYGYRVLIGDEHPTIVDLDEFIETFGGGLPTMVAWECGPGRPCAHALDRSSISVAQSITEAMIGLDGVRSVDSPANAPLLVPSEDGFAVRRLVENGSVVTDLDALRERASKDSLWSGRLLEPNGASAVVYVHAVDTESSTGAKIIDALDVELEKHEAAGYEFQLIGDFIGSVIGGRALTQSMSGIVPALVVVIGLILLILTRSWQSSVAVLITMGIALLWTVGLMGWLDWPQDGIHETLAPLILVVGVCDAVHLLTRAVGNGPNELASDRIVAAAAGIGPACAITTATTAVAFLSFTTSDLDSFFRYGTLCAFGICACLLLTFSLLPVMARRLPAIANEDGGNQRLWSAALSAIVDASIRRYRLVLAVSVVALAVGLAGWSRLEADNDWIEGFGRDSEISQGIRFADERYRTVHTLELELTPPSDEPLASPEILRRIERLSEFLSREPELGRAWSLLDHIRPVNRLLHDDDPAYEKIGESRELNSQIIELINLDDEDVLAPWLSLDRSSARLSVQADVVPFSEQRVLMARIESAVASVIPTSWKTRLTGTLAVNRDWVRDVQQTQLRSFPTAFVLVFLIVSWYLRSIRYGLAAMVPTLVPVVLTLGVMGWLGVTLDVGRSMVAAIVIGIGVDDAIHFLSAYKASRNGGMDPRAAAQAAIESTGQAIVTTSIALAIGFLTLTASAWQTVSSFGFFVSFTIVAALIATMFMLPALLQAFASRSEET